MTKAAMSFWLLAVSSLLVQWRHFQPRRVSHLTSACDLSHCLLAHVCDTMKSCHRECGSVFMRKVLILGAAGRDFHNFNVVFRHNPEFQVVAFTATQIPDIANRNYPPQLAGPLYPHDIPILDEKEMERIIAENGVNDVVFSYS